MGNSWMMQLDATKREKIDLWNLGTYPLQHCFLCVDLTHWIVTEQMEQSRWAETWSRGWCSFWEGRPSGSTTAVNSSKDLLMGESEGTHLQRERVLLLRIVIKAYKDKGLVFGKHLFSKLFLSGHYCKWQRGPSNGRVWCHTLTKWKVLAIKD